MSIPVIIRAVGRLLLPVDMPLPKKYWRWLWLALVVRLVIGVPFFLVVIGPYLLCKGVHLGLDKAGWALGSVPVRCYNRDLASSGWRQPKRFAPAVQLNPERAERIRPRRGA